MKGDGKIMGMKIKALLEDSKMPFERKMEELKTLKNQNEQIFDGLFSCDKEILDKWIKFLKSNKKNIETYMHTAIPAL
jgi:hypothetical protein